MEPRAEVKYMAGTQPRLQNLGVFIKFHGNVGMDDETKYPPNQLKPRPDFMGNMWGFTRRLKEEIAELHQMKESGFTHTTDGQSIEWQIAIRQEFLRQAAKSSKGGRW